MHKTFNGKARAFHGGDDREAAGDESGRGESRLANADDGNIRERPGRIEACVVEAGNDGGLCATLFTICDLDRKSVV